MRDILFRFRSVNIEYGFRQDAFAGEMSPCQSPCDLFGVPVKALISNHHEVNGDHDAATEDKVHQ